MWDTETFISRTEKGANLEHIPKCKKWFKKEGMLERQYPA